MGRKYGWDDDYDYNTFGADEHYVVTLYRLNRKGTKWKAVQSWRYSTFMASGIAHSRGERRIKKLRNIYGAKHI